MASDPEKTQSDKLYKTKYEADRHHSHIEVNREICHTCQTRFCITVCPAGVYAPDPNDAAAVGVSHENCLECGTCRGACPHGSVAWRYPDGGKGVKFRFG